MPDKSKYWSEPPWQNENGSTNVEKFLECYQDDDNVFWIAELGHIQNVLDHLIEMMPDTPEARSCICFFPNDVSPGTRIADLACPLHGVNGSEPGDYLPPASRPVEETP